MGYPIALRIALFSFNDDLWNATTPTEGWQKATVELSSTAKSDFQVFTGEREKLLFLTHKFSE